MVYKPLLWNDSVYEQIELLPIQKDLVNRPELERLHSIKQLGLSDLVYRTGNHTRLAHSTGAAYMAGCMARELDLTKEEQKLVVAALQLHDVSHLPFSHTLEPLYGKDNVQFSGLTFNGLLYPGTGGSISEVLQDHGIKPETLLDLIKGDYEEKQYLQQIVRGHDIADADQIDYLLRDTVHTGNKYGTIRPTRLIKTMKIHEGRIVYTEKGIGSIENFLFARRQMYKTTYNHKTALIAQAMLVKAAKDVINEFDVAELLTINDEQFLQQLESKGEYQKEMVKRLRYRNLFKKAFSLEIWDKKKYKGTLIELEKKGQETLESELADKAGISQGQIIVDFPEKGLEISEERMSNGSSKIKNDIPILLNSGELIGISELSPVAKAVMTDHGVPYLFGVYCPEEHREKVFETVKDMYFQVL